MTAQAKYAAIVEKLISKLDATGSVQSAAFDAAHRNEEVITRNSELLGRLASSVDNMRVCPMAERHSELDDARRVRNG